MLIKQKALTISELNWFITTYAFWKNDKKVYRASRKLKRAQQMIYYVSEEN
ncbi:hypothetical protein IV80_GL001785 [Pediococcus cellicola]|uniref:Uncharacterized protein n=1 Tax=Pediococcus cellicola TaxID=319652 RepID=A0A0R2IKD2_9LACO|nr:hypothetical protein IV80_GL001785 [Pediococcus cellicola]